MKQCCQMSMCVSMLQEPLIGKKSVINGIAGDSTNAKKKKHNKDDVASSDDVIKKKTGSTWKGGLIKIRLVQLILLAHVLMMSASDDAQALPAMAGYERRAGRWARLVFSRQLHLYTSYDVTHAPQVLAL